MILKRPPLILVADDDPLLAEIVEPLFGQDGYRVQLVTNGIDCLNKVQTELPDLILLDAIMPDPDGFICCERIRSLPYAKDIPILMITQLDDNVSVDRAFEAGATDYIPKPIHWRVLRQRIRRLLEASQDRHDNLQLIRELDYQVKVRNAELQEAVNFEKLLRVITDKVRSSLSEADVLATATQELTRGLHLGFCQVGIPHADGKAYTVAYHYSGYFNCSSEFSDPLVLMDPVILHQLQRGDTLIYSRMASASKPITVVSCSLFDSTVFLGFLALVRSQDQHFKLEEIRLAEQVANQCMIGIRQARLYQSAQAQMQRLAELYLLKSEFVRMMAHEYRNPLTTIQTSLAILKDHFHQLSPEKRLSHLDRIQLSTDRLGKLVEKVLLVEKANANRIEINHTPTDLKQLVQDIIEEVKFIDHESHPIQVVLKSSLGQIQIDPYLTQHILLNLLTNATKYSAAGCPITLSLEADPIFITITIQDQGIGIPKSDQVNLFKSFYRASNVGNRSGTGLGLVIVKQLIDLQGGSIRFESEVGQGTTFWVQLPRNPIRSHPTLA